VKLLEKLPPPEVLGPPAGSRTVPRSGTAPIVGIDFGTTYSSVAVMRAGIEVIPDQDGELQIPSVVSFPEPGVVLVGAEARARMAGSAQWTITSPKRLLGRPYKDPQVSQLVGGLALRSFAGTDKLVRFEAHGAIYSVPDICAMIMRELRARAGRFLGVEVSKVVLTVPVGFGSLQRSALELAASQAGLEVVGLLSEPGAAIIAHGFRGRHGLLAIYDFGGGTFDFCVLEVTDTTFQVLCGGGDTWLGGDDFDNALASYMADLFWNDTGVDLRTRTVEWQALVFACERAKRELSVKKETEVRCDDLLFTQQGRRGLRYKITRKKLAELTGDLVEKSILVTSKVLSQAGVKVKQVDAVVLTGGTCLVPAVREAVSKFFGKEGVLADPNLAVAKGAALRGAELSGEAVAGASLGGRTLREVAGRTIGAALQGGQPEVLFERSTPLPAEVRRTFHTTEDGQTEMVVSLYEETKERIDESRVIGHLRYKGLRPRPRGQGQVDFTFVLDRDGILHVSAVVEGKQYDRSIKLQ
jgi:molecular chaperone DnaK